MTLTQHPDNDYSEYSLGDRVYDHSVQQEGTIIDTRHHQGTNRLLWMLRYDDGQKRTAFPSELKLVKKFIL